MSTVDVFGESRLLANIRTVRDRIRVVHNASEVVVTKMGDLGGYGPVWYHADAMTNILSLSNVQKKYQVLYDSTFGDFFTMERGDGSTRVFRPTQKGLYASQLMPKPESKESRASLVKTVQEIDKSITRR